MAYEVVIGLEVHTELMTAEKLFCRCSTAFGGEQNTHVCEICAGMPGALPVLNKDVVEFAIRMGLATNCNITQHNRFDRKNYFYPDLAKAYQISQLYYPVCRDGYITLDSGKKITIHEIHMEEDAGKLVHDDYTDQTLADFNRSSVPLLEIVSNPDIRSAEEAVEYVEKLRAILQYTGVSDGKMQEGSLRCDVNISVREVGSDKLGVRTELKNINSFRSISRAIEAETERHIDVLESGGTLVQETRRWDDTLGESFSMRSKENAQDYKYFPDPDVPPVYISDEWIEEVRETLPELPTAKKERYMKEYGLPEYDTKVITASIHIVNLFETTLKDGTQPKEAANWVMGEVMRLLNESGTLPEDMSFDPHALSKIIALLKEGKINRSVAKEVFEKVFYDNIDPVTYIKENGLEIVTDTGLVEEVVKKVVADNPNSVEEYLGGRDRAFQYLMGQSMKALRGKASPQQIKELIEKHIHS